MPGPLEGLKSVGKRFLFSQDPANEPALPEVGQPTSWAGGFGKGLYDEFVRPLSSANGVAGMLAGQSLKGLKNVPPGASSQAVGASLPAVETLGEMNPQFTPAGGEAFYNMGKQALKSAVDPTEAAYKRILATMGR